MSHNVTPLPVRAERYFLAQTARGIQVINYQPNVELFVGGPFATKLEADAWLLNRKRRRINKLLMNTFWVVCAVGLLVWGWE